MENAKKQTLLSELKESLRITWKNEKTDSELLRIINNTESYMNHLLGAEVDYTAPGIMNELFIARSCYVWNDYADEFEDAYQKDILRARAICEVNESEESKDAESE